MRKCIIPGSFDPVTAGHAALIRTACDMFDEVCVMIVTNAEKSSAMFTSEERLEILEAACKVIRADGASNLTCKVFQGLTTDAARSENARYIVRGVRSSADFQYEYELSQISRRLAPELITVFIPSGAEYIHISSTYVRELIRYGLTDSQDLAAGTSEIIRRLYKS